MVGSLPGFFVSEIWRSGIWMTRIFPERIRRTDVAGLYAVRQALPVSLRPDARCQDFKALIRPAFSQPYCNAGCIPYGLTSHPEELRRHD